MKQNKGKNQVRVNLSSESSIKETKDFYKSAKITVDELRKFKEHSDKSDEELEKLADALFDLAVVAMKIIEEENKKKPDSHGLIDNQ